MDERIIALARVRDYFRMIHGKRVHVGQHDRKDENPSGLPQISERAAQRTSQWLQQHGQAEIARDREFNARAVGMNQNWGQQSHPDMAAQVPVHIQEMAADMKDSALISAMFRIDEDNLSPLDRAIMSEFRKRGLKINARLSNTSLNAWWNNRQP